MKTFYFISALLLVSLASCANLVDKQEKIVFKSNTNLQHKTGYGYAEKNIDCKYQEFNLLQHNESIIQPYISIVWSKGCMKWWYDNTLTLYDDIYLNLNFVVVFDRLHIDASVDSFAVAFRMCDVKKANRNNILNSNMPLKFVFWRKDLSVGSLNFQKEVDYAYLKKEFTPNYTTSISDIFELPINITLRKHELCWKYNIPQGKTQTDILLKRLSS